MKKVLIALGALVVLGLAAAGGVYLHYQGKVQAFEEASFGDASARVVTIPKGTDAQGVGKLLERAKIISSAEDWHLWFWWKKLNPKMKAGEFEFTGALTPQQVVDRLVKGEVKMHKVGPIAEGLRCDEIMPILAQSDLNLAEETLLDLCTSKAFLKKVGIKSDRLEGYLFPDTYSFAKGVTEEQVVEKMVQRAKEEYAKAEAQKGPGIKLSELEALTLASCIEKETGVPEERGHISSVFHNRLKRHIQLATDPTVLYNQFYLTGKFDKDLVHHGWVKARETPGPYNTYLNVGLPAGPISNPGAEAIKAALHPQSTEDIYFVASGHGGHVFCPNAACHEEASKRLFAQQQQ